MHFKYASDGLASHNTMAVQAYCSANRLRFSLGVGYSLRKLAGATVWFTVQGVTDLNGNQDEGGFEWEFRVGALSEAEEGSLLKVEIFDLDLDFDAQVGDSPASVARAGFETAVSAELAALAGCEAAQVKVVEVLYIASTKFAVVLSLGGPNSYEDVFRFLAKYYAKKLATAGGGEAVAKAAFLVEGKVTAAFPVDKDYVTAAAAAVQAKYIASEERSVAAASGVEHQDPHGSAEAALVEVAAAQEEEAAFAHLGLDPYARGESSNESAAAAKGAAVRPSVVAFLRREIAQAVQVEKRR